MATCLADEIDRLERELVELEAALTQVEHENAELDVASIELENENVALAAEIAELEIDRARLQAERDTLRACYQESLETIRRLELGLLGPKTERLPNDSQLTMDILALLMAGQVRDGACEASREETPERSDEDASEPEEPEPKPDKKKPTGRRLKPRDLPRLEVEVLPPEVRQEGLDAFERIGEESCEITERRRGGTVVVVYKKPKFKRKKRGQQRRAETGPGMKDAQGAHPVETEASSPVHEPGVGDADGAGRGERSSERDGTLVRDLAGGARQASRTVSIAERESKQDRRLGASQSQAPPRDGDVGPPEDDEASRIFVASPAELPIERGSAGPGLLAETIVRRWLDAMPLHRMVKMFARDGLPIAKSTICGWHETLAELVRPLVAAMHQDALEQPVLCTDATGVQVQAKGQCARGHFFVLIAPVLHVLFFYTKRHDSDAIDGIVGGFRGALVADAHSIYDHLYNFGDVIEVGCWSHVRRYFHKALNTDPERAKFALGRIAALFKIEERFTQAAPTQRLEARGRRSKPIVDELFRWCTTEALGVVDETPIQIAIRYALNQQSALRRFLENGLLPIHNNWSEGQLRREAVGRKNWIFLGTHDAGDTNARFMSLLASAELHGLEPYAYIRDLLCLLPSWPVTRVLELAPAYWTKTLENTDAQQRLDANIFRRVSMGLEPVDAHTP